MNDRRFVYLSRPVGIFFVLLLILAISLACNITADVFPETEGEEQVVQPTAPPGGAATQELIPTLTLPPQVEQPPATLEATPGDQTQATPQEPAPETELAGVPGGLTDLYNQVNPGVVNIRVFVTRRGASGEGAGSGFVLDDAGHIITNNHVVQSADQVIVIFYDGTEAIAEIAGTDDDSDLAVLRVEQLPEGAHPLPLGDSGQVAVGEWVVAIGNPFGIGSSMTIGIVSAVGRAIPSGATPYSIPEAVQTDAAINPGNSGGPLLNLRGEVIGVNAQIQTGGTSTANTGVGFAIPSNTVRRVAPVLIQQGSFQWPYLGIRGESVNLLIMQANNLDTQHGAYIREVVPGGPAAEAGMRGTQRTETINRLPIESGGDVVVEADGQPVNDLNDLLAFIAAKNPGEQMVLTIIRDGEQQQVTVNLQARPENFEDTEIFPTQP